MRSSRLTEAVLLKTLAVERQSAVSLRKVRRINDGAGLVLEIAVNGSASWIWRFKVNQRLSSFALGSWPSMDLNQARTAIERVRSHLESGIHPQALRLLDRFESQTDATHLDTVAALFETWMTTRNSRLKKSYQANIRAAMTKHVMPVIGHLKVENVTSEHVSSCLTKLSVQEAYEMRRRVSMWMSRMFEFAMDSGKYEQLKAKTFFIRES